MTEMASHLVRAGGKRLRPLLAALSSTAGDAEAVVSDEAVTGGVACELVHVGSLHHDDVIDEAETRHGVDSVNARWGNLRAILSGDFLLARASELAASLGTEVAGLLASTIGRLCTGEVRELQLAYQVDRTVDDYEAAIEGKTAALYSTACRIGGIVADLPRDRDRRPHRLRPALRHGVPGGRRHPRRGGHRRRAGQAGGPRHGRGRLQPAGAAHAGRPGPATSCGRCWAARSTPRRRPGPSRSSGPATAWRSRSPRRAPTSTAPWPPCRRCPRRPPPTPWPRRPATCWSASTAEVV